MSFTKATNNDYAQILKSLHQPGNPVIFTNIFDTTSANALISINSTTPSLVKAAATASYALAAKLSIADEELSLSQNLGSVAAFASLIRDAGLPLSMDLQDGYGGQIVEAVRGAISAGAVGANIEDSYPDKGFGGGMACLMSIEEATGRIRLALKTATEAGVPDFVVNARTDALCLKPIPEGQTRQTMLHEAMQRGRAYLRAGATSVFVWSGPGGNTTTVEIKILVAAFEGRLAVKLGGRKDDLSVKELADLGLCRVSIGPMLYGQDSVVFKNHAVRILQGGQFWNVAE